MKKMHEAMRDENLDQPWTLGWDVIQFNVGLHDLKYLSGKKLDKKNGVQVSLLDVYQKNVGEIVKYLKGLAPDAKLIFATTTPVPDGESARMAGDATKYNQVAKQGDARISGNRRQRSLPIYQAESNEMVDRTGQCSLQRSG